MPPAGLIAASRQLRARFGIPEDAVLFGAFGLVTPEKRIGPILRAFQSIAAGSSNVHLLLAGGSAPHYDAVAAARALGIGDRVHLTGYVPDEELPVCVQAADVCLCLRWPTGGETSGTWLRAIAAGKPTLVTDLAHAGQVPSLEPEGWTVLPPTLARPETLPYLASRRAGTQAGPYELNRGHSHATVGADLCVGPPAAVSSGAGAVLNGGRSHPAVEADPCVGPPAAVSSGAGAVLNGGRSHPTVGADLCVGPPADPISVSIDILREESLLPLAMRRLAADAGLREDLGRAARRYWSVHHTMDCAVDDYRRVIERALARPVELARDLPAHLLPDPLAGARRIAAEMGIGGDFAHLTPMTPGGTLDVLNGQTGRA